jgi:hypothetical protein
MRRAAVAVPAMVVVAMFLSLGGLLVRLFIEFSQSFSIIFAFRNHLNLYLNNALNLSRKWHCKDKRREEKWTKGEGSDDG